MPTVNAASSLTLAVSLAALEKLTTGVSVSEIVIAFGCPEVKNKSLESASKNTLAAAKLIKMSGGCVAGFIFVINLFDLGGSDNLIKANYKVDNLLDELKKESATTDNENNLTNTTEETTTEMEKANQINENIII